MLSIPALMVLFTYCAVNGYLDLLVEIFPEIMVLRHDDTDVDYKKNFIGAVRSFCETKVTQFCVCICMITLVHGDYRLEHTVIVEAQHFHRIRDVGRSRAQQSRDGI